MPYLKIVGGLALFYIAAKLLVPEDEDEDEVEAVDHLWRAVRIVAVADIIMSLDNVIAIAAAAKGNFALILIGLAISIPLIVAGAALIMSLLERFPIWSGPALRCWDGSSARHCDGPGDRGLSAAAAGDLKAYHYVTLFAALAGAILVLSSVGLWRRVQAGRGRTTRKEHAAREKVSAAEEMR